MPRPSVRVCHAWCAKIVKFVGKNAEVDRKFVDILEFPAVLFSSRERRWRSCNGRAWRIVNDFTMNWPPKRRPLTSEEGLKEKSEVFEDTLEV